MCCFFNTLVILSISVSSISLILSNKFEVDKYFQICLDVDSFGSNLNSGLVL